MSKQPVLYDVQSLEELERTGHLKKYPQSVLGKGVATYITNFHADFFLLEIEELLLHVIVPKRVKTNTYVCSPYGHYIAYACDNLHTIKSKTLQKIAKSLFGVFGQWLRSGAIEDVVYVNHQLLSIDLYPKSFTKEVQEQVTTFLKKKFPDKAIIFRSVNNVAYSSMSKDLENLGYGMFPTRHVYMAHAKAEELFKRRIIKSDIKLYNEMPYSVIEGKDLNDEDIMEMCRLYRNVYIEGHSSLNPEVTPEFIKLLLEENVLHFKALKDKNGEVKGFVGFQICEEVLLCPLFGYDKEDPEHSALYRILNTVLLLEARKRGLLFNAAAGASFFKKIRYPLTCMESKAVYYQHLSFRSRLRWNVLKAYANHIAAHFMKKY